MQCCIWLLATTIACRGQSNVISHAQKPDFVFWRNGRVHLNQRGHQFSRLLAAEVCASVVVMLDTPYSEVVWRVLATHCIRQFPLHFPTCVSPCAITFQLESTLMDTCLVSFILQSPPHNLLLLQQWLLLSIIPLIFSFVSFCVLKPCIWISISDQLTFNFISFYWQPLSWVCTHMNQIF